MKKPIVILWVGLLTFCLMPIAKISAQAIPDPPRIVISQIKITTSSQFITLYNNTGSTLDLRTIQLQYFNNYDLSKATSGKLIALSGSVSPGGSVVVNDGPLLMCYQSVVESVSLGLSTTSGFVQVSHFPSSGTPQTVSILDDYIGWSKTAAVGAQPLPPPGEAFLQRQPLDSQNRPQLNIPGAGTWSTVQPDAADPCTLVSYVSGTTSVSPVGNRLLPGIQPPATIVSLSSSPESTGPSMPPSNRGLMAPQITELLPNPAKPQTDADDEFIEIYNSNSKPFDLTGFSLQVGNEKKRSYKFKDGTALAASSFRAFFSDELSVSLANTGSLVELLDPFGNVISRTDAYGSAKDGQSWALANGQWYWTSTPTASAANVIKQAGTAAGPTSSGSSAGSVRGASASATAFPSSLSDSGGQPDENTLHPGVLAGVGTLAVLYGLYEYRNDLANQINRFRRYRETRRGSGQSN